MKITQSKAKNMVATIKVEVSENDYSEKVNSVLKRYRKDAVVPGFRKGKTPMSIIEKQYKTSVMVDEVNKLLQDNLYKHITDNKVKVLGSPLPKEEKEIDWKNNTEFIFEYEIGLAPELNFKITKKDKLTYYNIEADNKLVDNYCNDIAKRYGKMSNPSESIDGDLVYCLITQMNSNGNILENGISNEATISIESIIEKKYKKKFIGLKADDRLSLNVLNVFKNKTDLSAMLKVSQAELSKLSSDLFEFTVKRINRLAPAELNKDLFEKVYPNEKVKSLKDFQSVKGYLGSGWASSYSKDPKKSSGSLISPTIKIKHRFLNFLVGGGQFVEVGVELWAEGERVLVSRGENSDRLVPKSWDLEDYYEKEVEIRIVDNATGRWAHVHADQFEFSKFPSISSPDKPVPPISVFEKYAQARIYEKIISKNAVLAI